MLRRALLTMAHSDQIKDLATRLPITAGVVARFVAGESADDALRVAGELVGAGLRVSLDRLGEDTLQRAQAVATRDAYVGLLARLHEAGLTPAAEVSVKLSAVGQARPGDGEKIAYEHAAAICEAAAAAGTTVTLDMEDHTTTDSTLSILRDLRVDFPFVGAVLQAYLRRTEADCRDLAGVGVRVRLCKGAYDEPASVAFTTAAEVDRSYVRCARVLLGGDGYPMFATHDPRLIEIVGAVAASRQRASDSYEYQMLYGVRPLEQRRLAAAGETVRVYVPYGDEWYGYLVRRMAERPANLAVFLRSLVTRS